MNDKINETCNEIIKLLINENLAVSYFAIRNSLKDISEVRIFDEAKDELLSLGIIKNHPDQKNDEHYKIPRLKKKKIINLPPWFKDRPYEYFLWREKMKSVWIFFSGLIIVATFLILIYDTWFNPSKINHPPTEITTPSNTPHEAPLDIGKVSAKKDSATETTDTTSKQNSQPTKPVEHATKKTRK